MIPIPKEWESVALGDTGTWRSGGTPDTSCPEYWNGHIPWISSGSLISSRLWDSDRRLTDLGSRSGTRLVDRDSLLMVVRGMSLKSEFRVGIAMRTMAFGQDCKALTPRPGVDPIFLLYALLARVDQVLGLVDEAGHGTGRLNTDQLQAVQIGLPASDEQRAIADVLGALDDKIAANARLSEGAERLALALVESSGSLVPLGDVVTHRKLVVDPSALTSERVAHFSLPAFDSGRTPEMVEPRTIKSSKFLVTSPSVLVSKLNPRFLRTWDVATVPDRPALASTEFLVLEPRFSTSTVMWALLSQSTFGAVLESKVAGTSGSHQRVRPEDLLGTPVPDPRAMSDKLKDQVTSLGLRAIQARVESDHLAATRGALLPALMSGRLRVRDAQRDSAGRSQVG